MHHLTTVWWAPRFQRVRGGKARPAGADAMAEEDDGPPDDADEMSRVTSILQVCALRCVSRGLQGLVPGAIDQRELATGLQACAMSCLCGLSILMLVLRSLPLRNDVLPLAHCEATTPLDICVVSYITDALCCL